MSDWIFLDHAAGGPLRPQAAAAMLEVMQGPAGHANPASGHPAGRSARDRVEQARATLAACIGARSDEIIWTSGATESNNLAIKGAMAFYAGRGRHLVTSRIEHRSVLDAARHLQAGDCRVGWVEPDRDGRITAEAVEAALADDTVLVSIQYVNNETGVIHDIPAIAAVTRARGVLLHVDAAQALGRVPIDLRELPVDLMSLAAHKVGGPRGIGALFVRRRPRARLVPLLHGGGHEQGMRSGTLSVHQIAGFAAAAAQAVAERVPLEARHRQLRERLEAGLTALGGVQVHAAGAARVPAIGSAGFTGVHGEALRAMLGPLCVSGGSACSSQTAEPSYVLRALGCSELLAGASLRFSFGPETTPEEIDAAVAIVGAAVRRLRQIAGEAPAGAGPRVPLDEGLPAPVRTLLGGAERLGDPAALGPDRLQAELSSPAHGIRLRLGVLCSGGRVRAARAAVVGCPWTIACAEYLCRRLEQGGALAFDAEDCARALELPAERRHCALLMEDLVAALPARPAPAERSTCPSN